MEPPSPQLHTNSSAPTTRRLIKAMHLFMTELIKQGKRWSPLWKHISPRGNRLWSRSPQAVSGHRFWIFVTYEETASCNAFKKRIGGKKKKHQLWGDEVIVQDILQGIFEAAWTGPVITCIGHWLGDEKKFHLQDLCFAFLSSGLCEICSLNDALPLIGYDNCSKKMAMQSLTDITQFSCTQTVPILNHNSLLPPTFYITMVYKLI